MTFYLDSSAVLRYLLSGDALLRRLKKEDKLIASELVEIECKRVLQRERLENAITDARYSSSAVMLAEILEMADIVELDPEIKKRAGEAFPTVIGTLDALHLATALRWRDITKERIRMISYDRQLLICAEALGIRRFPDGIGLSSE